MTSDRIITGGTYRLVDIVDSSNVIRNLVATDVTFYGPAVLIVSSATLDSDNVYEDVVWTHGEGGIEALIWEVDPIRERVVGAIGMANCEFIRCTFIDVGVAGKPDDIALILGSLYRL